jgi:AMMECR1 domain-containing protein
MLRPFLPEVAKEFNWTKEEALGDLAQKGGFRGKCDRAAIGRFRVERYESGKCVATPAEDEAHVRTR